MHGILAEFDSIELKTKPELNSINRTNLHRNVGVFIFKANR